MKKIAIFILSLIFITGSAFASDYVKGPFNYSLYDDINRPKNSSGGSYSDNQQNEQQQQQYSGPQYYSSGYNAWEHSYNFYPEATIGSAIQKYKKGDYSGSLQELISLTKKDSSNPLIYYYMGMAYTQVGDKEQAINAYEIVMRLNPNDTLTAYATKGRDCLVGGPTCVPENVIEDDLDKFINAPYGNGLSEEVNQQMKEQKLRDIQQRINKKEILEKPDKERIQDFDNNKSEAPKETSDKIAEVSNEDVLKAIETLKKAGVTVSINPYQPSAMTMNNEYSQLSMLLGNNNNNNNSMMNMLPMLMAQQNEGKNIDPQVIQAKMMNSMLPDFTFNDKKDY